MCSTYELPNWIQSGRISLESKAIFGCFMAEIGARQAWVSAFVTQSPTITIIIST